MTTMKNSTQRILGLKSALHTRRRDLNLRISRFHTDLGVSCGGVWVGAPAMPALMRVVGNLKWLSAPKPNTAQVRFVESPSARSIDDLAFLCESIVVEYKNLVEQISTFFDDVEITNRHNTCFALAFGGLCGLGALIFDLPLLPLAIVLGSSPWWWSCSDHFITIKAEDRRCLEDFTKTRKAFELFALELRLLAKDLPTLEKRRQSRDTIERDAGEFAFRTRILTYLDRVSKANETISNDAT